MKRLLFIAFLFTAVSAKAQYIDNNNYSHHEVGIMAGVANYYGDLQKEYTPDYGYRAMGGIFYKYFFNPRLGVRLGASYASITAADSLSSSTAQQIRNLRFGTNIFEMHGGFELNLFKVDFNYSKFSPYIFAGVAAFYSNPYTDAPSGERVYLRPLSTEGQGMPTYPDRKEYSVINAAFPIGGGLKVFVGNTLMITAELGLRYTSYDYLDDVSKSYVPLDSLAAYRGQAAADFSFRSDELEGFDGNYPDYKFQRGDSKANDWYWFGGITVGIYFQSFGNTADYLATKCPGIFRKRR